MSAIVVSAVSTVFASISLNKGGMFLFFHFPLQHDRALGSSSMPTVIVFYTFFRESKVQLNTILMTVVCLEGEKTAK